DRSALYLSTHDSPDNEAQIAAEPERNDPRQWVATSRRSDPPENRSTPIPLQAGKGYFIRVLHQEGQGGDNVGVTWQLPGAPEPQNGDPPIDGKYIASFINPDGLTLAITRQPEDVTAAADSPVMFSVRYAA